VEKLFSSQELHERAERKYLTPCRFPGFLPEKKHEEKRRFRE
jgi:hypothetical protein